jgi:nucleoside-diphosphate-sugar epimerase
MGTDRKLALVTGAAGLVGDRIAKRLLRDGLLVRTLDQRPVDVAGAECCQADVTDPVAVQRAAAGAALVVHCAAVITGTPEEILRVNVEGTRLLAETALQQGCERFLYMSTLAVYALEGRAVVDEATPFLTEGPAFQLSRVRAEQAVWTASARGLPVTVFRAPSILGAHPTSTWSALLAQRLLKGDFVLSGDGSGSFPYVHVDNLVEAIISAAHTARAIGQAYNIIDGQTTGRAYTDRFCHWLGLEPLPARREVVPWCGRVVGAKAERELDYVTRVSYEAAMAETEGFLVESGMIKR